jgi:hypothetical protein
LTIAFTFSDFLYAVHYEIIKKLDAHGLMARTLAIHVIDAGSILSGSKNFSSAVQYIKKYHAQRSKIVCI